MRPSARPIVWMLFLSLFFLAALGPASAGDNNPPTLHFYEPKPSQGMFKTTYLLQARYTDADNQPPARIVAVVNNESYGMKPLSYLDTNYTDGKDYFVEVELGRGVHTVYFETSDGANTTQTNALLLNVPGYFDTEHGDIMKSVFILTPIFVFLVLMLYYQGWRLTKSVDRLAEKRKDAGASGGARMDEEMDSTPEGASIGEGAVKEPDDGEQG